MPGPRFPIVSSMGGRQSSADFDTIISAMGSSQAVTPPFPSVNDYLIANSRLLLNQNTTNGTGNAYVGGSMVMISPAWDVVSPRFGFAGFVGITSFGEQALGNDHSIEGLYVEVNGVKNWLIGNGTAGSGSILVPNGAHAWSPENAVAIPANSMIRVGWIASIAASGKLPASGPNLYPASYGYTTSAGKGDYNKGVGPAGTVFSDLTNDAGGAAVSTVVSASGAPIAFIAKPANAAAAAVAKAMMIVGHSIDYARNTNQSIYAARVDRHLATSPWTYALNDPSGGRIPWCNFAIPGTRMRDMVNAGGTGGGASAHAGWAMRDAMMAAVGYPWTVAGGGFPINDISLGSSTGDVTGAVDECVAAFKARGNRRFLLGTSRPYTNTVGGWGFTGGASNQASRTNDTWIPTVDTYILGKPGGLDDVIDIRDANDTGGKASPTRRWKDDGAAGTLTAATNGAVTGAVGGTGGVSSTTLTVTAVTSGAIGVGSRIGTGTPKVYVVQQLGGTPGGAGTYQLNIAQTIADGTALTISGTIAINTSAPLVLGDFYALDPSSSAGTLDLLIIEAVSGNTAVLTTTITKAHAVGASIVGQRSNDGLHLVAQGMRAEAAIIAATKGIAIR